MIYAYRFFYFFLFLFHVPKLLLTNRRALYRRLFPPAQEGSLGPCVWVHAVSMGEVVAIVPIVKALMAVHPTWKWVLSTTTETGLSTAHSLFPTSVRIVQMPFDFRSCIRAVLRAGTPFLVLLSEGDVWPVFLNEVRLVGAKVVLCNGKVSDKTIHRLLCFPRFGRWLYSFVDLFCLQNQTFWNRFAALGIDPKKLTVTGSTKADVGMSLLSEGERLERKKLLGIGVGKKVVVVGSTHAPEEQQIVSALLPILKQDPTCKVMIVPRHPERFDEVVACLPGTAVRYTTYQSGTPWNIMVVDQVGLLTVLYQLADVAIVAGSFVERVGGHNILEPAIVGIPVIVGPYMHSQRALYESAREADGVMEVSLDTLQTTVETLLHDGPYRKAHGQKALFWAESLRGATQKTVTAIEQRFLYVNNLLKNVN